MSCWPHEAGSDYPRKPRRGEPFARANAGLFRSRKRFLAWRAGTPGLPPGQRDALTAQAQREAMALGYRVFRTHAAMAEEKDA